MNVASITDPMDMTTNGICNIIVKNALLILCNCKRVSIIDAKECVQDTNIYLTYDMNYMGRLI